MMPGLAGDGSESGSGSWDLTAAAFWAALSIVTIFAVPDGNALRWAIGLPMLFFVPGYALVSALWPEKGSKGAAGKDEAKGAGLGGEERLALGLGMSLVVTAVTGVALNFAWSLSGIPVAVSLASATFFFVGFAYYRRMKLPANERYHPDLITYIKPRGGASPDSAAKYDRGFMVALAVCITIIVVLSAYVATIPRQGDGYSEFYMLDKDGTIQGLPRNITVNGKESVLIGIVCHEGRTVNYSVIASTGNSTLGLRASNWDEVHNMTSGSDFILNKVIQDGKMEESEFEFVFRQPGTYRMTFILGIDGTEREYELHITVHVN
jgi:uncharacterized membrane protein